MWLNPLGIAWSGTFPLARLDWGSSPDPLVLNPLATVSALCWPIYPPTWQRACGVWA